MAAPEGVTVNAVDAEPSGPTGRYASAHPAIDTANAANAVNAVNAVSDTSAERFTLPPWPSLSPAADTAARRQSVLENLGVVTGLLSEE
jgi:hypothetical protein